ncbi:helix-turn-helix protein [Herbihabitans rhizosphaerae]|uniref:Helix-turn-helix protein n=1 Tax=Herbihabitans rhizosphaerae TaxID=1872711 RepID=A0A4V2ESV9_9PSEU|nr:helix-turn-helix transcriptional regulator [Herbihabitans rhizosphaerae]RZS38933.1 helix-turn-helix protein [Herbihabitans rhizosphaerae]
MTSTSIGCLIRDLRVALSWSQGRLADELCRVSGHSTATREDVSRWERGKRTPGPYWLAHLATVLEVPLHVLEDAKMDRRTFVTSLAATAVAPVVTADLIREGFDAALHGGPDTEAWLDRLARYGADYMTAGAAQIQQRVAHDLVVIQQQLESPVMWGVAAKLMTLFAKTFPGADGAKAVTWYRRAAIAADRSEDNETRVWVRGRAAIALGYEGAALPVADLFAEQATQIEDKPSIGRLNAVMGKAHVAALRGDDNRATELLYEGKRLFDRAGSDDVASSDYAVPFWRMNVFMSLLLARHGAERNAIVARETAMEYLPATLPRFRTHLEMHHGLMMVRSGDRKGGVAYAEEALNALPPEKHSLTLRMLLGEIRDS